MSKIGVIGAGLMGSGIAQVAAQTGFQVSLMDVEQRFVDKGLATIDKNLKRMIDKGKMEASEADAVRSRIKGTLSLGEAASDVDVTIEAVIEKMDLKRSVYKELDGIAKPSTIFATNTSGLSITAMAAVTSRPDRFIGMHFFNPVPAMKLVEVIRGYGTSDETVKVIKTLAQKMGKTAIEVVEAPGFVVNRILVPMINEAIFALQEGLASAAEIDEGMKLGANHPMGPLALADLVGLDTLLNVQQHLYEEFADPKYRPPTLLRKMVRAGHLGRKSGKGFYDYGS
ncbi:MAG: 3-hydroxybutyryl-CoA dehydrogenase [Desulfomonile tiedjei]|nr:3-hydroxybutyryl-CoA dehydrogenase [Desulfomonile tiedjei]